MAVADDITTGTVSLITDQGYSGVTVRSRKQTVTTELDTPTLVTVSVEEDRDEFETADDDAGRAGFYTLILGIARRNSGDGLTGALPVRDLRQNVRRLLTGNPGLGGTVPAVDWVDTLPSRQFDVGLLDEGWDYSWLLFSVKTREPRD